MSNIPKLTYKQKRAVSWLREHGSVFVPEVGQKYCRFGRFEGGRYAALSPIEAVTSDELLDLGLVELYIMTDQRRLLVLTGMGQTVSVRT